MKKLSFSSPDKWEAVFTNDDKTILKAAKVSAEKYLNRIQEARTALAKLLRVKVDGSTFTIDTILTHVSAWNDFTPKYEALENGMKSLAKRVDEIEKDAQKLSKIHAKDKALKISQEVGLAIAQIATTLRKEQGLAMQSARSIERAFRLIGIQISRAMNAKEKQDKAKNSKTPDSNSK